MEDLWPDFDIKGVIENHPVYILKEQAAVLGNKTKNLVTGEVVGPVPKSRYDFLFHFFINSGVINYQFHLFSIGFNLEIWPVTFINLNKEMVKSGIFVHTDANSKEFVMAQSVDDFKNILTEIFSSPPTRNLIATMYQQTKIDDFG